jgi:hypothetical protein
MYDIGGVVRDEMEALMKHLALPASPWWDHVPTAFEPELSHPTQVQLRLDSSFLALVLRSHFSSLRHRCYQLLAERSLSFAVASGCERISRRHPDAAWLLKLGVTGNEPHAKLYFDLRHNLEELGDMLLDLGLDQATGLRAAEGLLAATGAEKLRCLSVAPGRPLRAELYVSRPPEPGGAANSLRALGRLVGMESDETFEALVELHPRLSLAGRQRYAVGVDGDGLRDGIKVSYADVDAGGVAALLDALTPAPVMARRRFVIANRELASEGLDHVSVRLRSGRPAHITAYYNRSYAAVA